MSQAIFRTEDIIGNFSGERSMQIRLKNLINDGRVAKIKNGLYATVNPITGDIFANRFEIASALFDNACVAYHSALEFHGLGNQVYSEVYVFSDVRNIPFEYGGLAYKFFLPKTGNGVDHLERNAPITVTNLERTVADCLDRIDLAGGLEELVTAIGGITYLNEELLVAYLKEYNKKILYKKAGFLLSLLKSELFSQRFFDLCKSNLSYKIDDVSENKKLQRRTDREWGIIYPATLVNTEN